MRSESPSDSFPFTTLPIGDEAVTVMLAGRYLWDRLSGVITRYTLLTGPVPPGDAEARAMVDLLAVAGAVARAVPVADALKFVEDGLVTGTIDRAAVVALRLPVLARTATLRALATAAGEGELDLIAALAAAGPVAVFVRDATAKSDGARPAAV